MDELPPDDITPDDMMPGNTAPAAAGDSAFSAPGLADSVTWAGPADAGPLPAAEVLGMPLAPVTAASPRLRDKLFARLLAYGTPQQVQPGDVLFRPGDEDVDLIVVSEGSVDVIRTETADVPAQTVARVQAGGFAGS